MTVAEAIEMKSSIDYKKSLLLKLQLDYRNAINEVERKNNNFESRLNSYLESIGKNTKLQDEETKKQIKTFTDNNEAKLLDTLLIKKEINKLQEEIEVFESEVDLVLSESNAVTILFKNNGE
jgi:formyltetrahydrofolate hydrolase